VSPIVELRDVAHRYPACLGSSAHQAVQGVSFALHQPAILGVVGTNGSGKSTTLKLLVGLYRPTAGTVRLWGLPSGHREVQPRIGYLSENPRFPEGWSGRELARVSRAAHRGETGRACQTGRRNPGVGGNRGGGGPAHPHLLPWHAAATRHRRRVRASAGLAGPGRTDFRFGLGGESPRSCARLRALQLEGTTVVVALHQASEIERFCDRVVCLRGGRVIADGVAGRRSGPGSAAIPAGRASGDVGSRPSACLAPPARRPSALR
jgi:ABC-2 type transport system ATP-binding protein